MRVQVTVKPGSSKGPLVVEEPDGLIVYLHAKAIDGAANKELLKTLAAHFSVPKTSISIVRGATSRIKMVEVGE
jgi:uncharacterized protein YggU (UPF0235/DUF167 family)